MKKILRRILIAFAVLSAILLLVYLAGPRPAQPQYAPPPPMAKAASLEALETSLKQSEAAEPGIKPGCEATIVWADSLHKTRTPVVFVYFHGFGASHEEGAPVHQNIARAFGGNLLLSRLDEHGVSEGEHNMEELTADSYVESGEKALQIAGQLGDSVVILATSGGAGLSLFLAARHPEIKSLVLWSPCVRLYSGMSGILAGPWGLQIARAVRGGQHNDWAFKKPEMAAYWTNHQRFEGIVQFCTFLETALVPETFAKIKCPVFIGYYYRDEAHQDMVVSVAAMRQMFGQLGTPAAQKREMAFPGANNHVITCYMTSDDWSTVQQESIDFLRDVVAVPLHTGAAVK